MGCQIEINTKVKLFQYRKTAEVGLCKKYSHVESAIANIQQNSSAFKHDASQPHPKCHLGTMSSLSNIAQLKPINTITSLGTAKGHTLKLITTLLLKGTWNILNLDRVHPSIFLQGSKRAPCPFARTGLCENVTLKLFVCEGVSEEP